MASKKSGNKGITPRATDYSAWYTDLILKAELAEYSPVKGCMVIRPRGYAIWERIRETLNEMIVETGHENAYFPLFIPESFLKKEAEHVEGFAPECAVVTHAGGSKLEEPLIIRPTSETIMYHMFAKWIQSYRDLPLLINQWANVVRWEMRPRLFLRTCEFLWQEGHTAHETLEQAEEETRMTLGLYRKLAEETLAIPVYRGIKSESEKFAGALHTYCIEAVMQDGKCLQAGTSHNLGQNFAKAFNVQYQNREGGLAYAWQTSWGVSTRLIGALIMTHSDDQGLVLPPKVAPMQTVIVPIYRSDEERDLVLETARAIQRQLKEARVRVHLDDRDQYKPGFKFNDWELKGVPLRIELGPRDIAASKAMVARRDTGEKSEVTLDGLVDEVKSLLDTVQQAMFDKAKAFRDEKTIAVDSYDALKTQVAEGAGIAVAGWCGHEDCEARVKEDTKATIRLIPFEGGEGRGACTICGKDASHTVYFAKAY
ncbi:MAG: proline--tRNA ligase [Planctomycetes bacterium]|nr:proline--tRNA ligase [Planctomycetota bacterium]